MHKSLQPREVLENTSAADRWLSNFPDSTESARAILPLLFAIIGLPRTMVDLGGGIGAWCKAAEELGVQKVTCIDAPETSSSTLLIAPSSFIGHDLSRSVPDPIKADLAMSLEFAEHVPTGRSNQIVRFLTESAPVVLFAASIPGQPGLGHINEQPPNFWKSAFEAFGYKRWDIVRPQIHTNEKLPYWYRQNCYVFANESMDSVLAKAPHRYNEIAPDFELVHEKLLKRYRSRMQTLGLRAALREFSASLRQSLQRLGHGR